MHSGVEVIGSGLPRGVQALHHVFQDEAGFAHYLEVLYFVLLHHVFAVGVGAPEGLVALLAGVALFARVREAMTRELVASGEGLVAAEEGASEGLLARVLADVARQRAAFVRAVVAEGALQGLNAAVSHHVVPADRHRM